MVGDCQSAARLHHLQRGSHPRLAEAPFQPGEVVVDDRFHIGIEGGHHSPLIFPEGRVDLMRKGQHQAGVAFGDQRLGPALMVRIDEGEHEADGDGLDTVRHKLVRGAQKRGLVEWDDHVTRGGYALGNLLAIPPRSKETRRLGLQHDPVHLGAQLSTNLENVAKALRCDEADLGSLALKDRIGGHRRPVRETTNRIGRKPPAFRHFGQRLQNRGARIAARRRHLHEAHGAVRLPAHDIREGAADVDANLDGLTRSFDGHFFPTDNCRPARFLLCERRALASRY